MPVALVRAVAGGTPWRCCQAQLRWEGRPRARCCGAASRQGHHDGFVLINLELEDAFHLVRLQTVSSFLSKLPCS